MINFFSDIVDFSRRRKRQSPLKSPFLLKTCYNAKIAWRWSNMQFLVA